MLSSKKEVKEWLIQMRIENYSIQDDLTVDVDGAVNLYGQELTEIPVQFGQTKDFFVVNNKLTSLLGCPHTVDGPFNCSENLLTTLEHGPIKVSDDYYCYNNKIVSLLGCAEKIGRSFCCAINNLTSLQHLPKEITGNVYLENNNLTSFEHIPSYIGGFLRIDYNPITSVQHLHGNIAHGLIHGVTESHQLIPFFKQFYLYNEETKYFQLELSKKELERILFYKGINDSTPNNNCTTKKIKI